MFEEECRRASLARVNEWFGRLSSQDEKQLEKGRAQSSSKHRGGGTRRSLDMSASWRMAATMALTSSHPASPRGLLNGSITRDSGLGRIARAIQLTRPLSEVTAEIHAARQQSDGKGVRQARSIRPHSPGPMGGFSTSQQHKYVRHHSADSVLDLILFMMIKLVKRG